MSAPAPEPPAQTPMEPPPSLVNTPTMPQLVKAIQGPPWRVPFHTPRTGACTHSRTVPAPLPELALAPGPLLAPVADAIPL